MQTAVANVRAKTKYVFIQKEQIVLMGSYKLDTWLWRDS